MQFGQSLCVIVVVILGVCAVLLPSDVEAKKRGQQADEGRRNGRNGRRRDRNREWQRDPPGRGHSSQPNIVMIMTDDQDTELGSLNFMPKLNKLLASHGAHFTNAFVTTPICCPSRSSMLTGMYVHNHNVFTNNENCSSLVWQQTHETRNFGTYLSNAGYRTGYFGKYLNDYDGAHIPPGWTEWLALIKNSRFYNYTLNFNGKRIKHADNYYKDYFTDLIANDSVTFLKQSKQYFPTRPVAMVLSMPAPHGPEDAAPQYQHLFDNITTHRTPSWNHAPNPDKQWLLQHVGKMEPIHVAFTDIVQRKRLQTLQSVDDAIEKVVNELRDLGELDNTYIVYTSDHGYHLGQFGLIKGKSMPYEFDIRVPFFMRGPSIPSNVKVKSIVLNVDIAPTLLDMAGIPIPEQMDGKSILKLFEGANKVGSVVGGVLRQKRAWRDTFLVERGKVTNKKLLWRDKLEEQMNSARPFQETMPKEQRVEQACERAEYQPPCTPNQEWVCVRVNGRLRLSKCKGGEAVLLREDCQCPTTMTTTTTPTAPSTSLPILNNREARRQQRRQQRTQSGRSDRGRSRGSRYRYKRELDEVENEAEAEVPLPVDDVIDSLQSATVFPTNQEETERPRRRRRPKGSKKRRKKTRDDGDTLMSDEHINNVVMDRAIPTPSSVVSSRPPPPWTTSVTYSTAVTPIQTASFDDVEVDDLTDHTTQQPLDEPDTVFEVLEVPDSALYDVEDDFIPDDDEEDAPQSEIISSEIHPVIEQDLDGHSSGCRVLPNNTVHCDRQAPAGDEWWRAQSQSIDSLIEDFRAKLDELKGIKKMLRRRRPTYPSDDDEELDTFDDDTNSRRNRRRNERRGYVVERVETPDDDVDDDERSELVEHGMPEGTLVTTTLTPEDCDCEMQDDPSIEPVGNSRRGQRDRIREERQQRREELQREREERRQEKKRRNRNGGRDETEEDFVHDCNSPRMKCFEHNNDHWRTPPFWTLGPFCFCPNTNNNTFWCLRTINDSHDTLYCEFITGFISYYDLARDPYQLRNAVFDLSYDILHELHEELEKLKGCKGSRECNVRSRPPDDITDMLEEGSGEVDVGSGEVYSGESGEDVEYFGGELGSGEVHQHDTEKERFLLLTTNFRLDSRCCFLR